MEVNINVFQEEKNNIILWHWIFCLLSVGYRVRKNKHSLIGFFTLALLGNSRELLTGINIKRKRRKNIFQPSLSAFKHSATWNFYREIMSSAPILWETSQISRKSCSLPYLKNMTIYGFGFCCESMAWSYLPSALSECVDIRQWNKWKHSGYGFKFSNEKSLIKVLWQAMLSPRHCWNTAKVELSHY